MLFILMILSFMVLCRSDQATEHQLRQYYMNRQPYFQKPRPVFSPPSRDVNGQPEKHYMNNYKSQWDNIFNSHMFTIPPKYQPRVSNYRDYLPQQNNNNINIKTFNQNPHKASGRGRSRQFHFEKSPPKSLSNEQCGKLKPQVRRYVANGKPTSHVEWPWYVQIVVKSDAEAYCGGTLISKNYILTAAHCFDDIPAYALARSTTVLLKGVRMSKDQELKVKASSIFIHPEYVPAMGSAEAAELNVEPGPRNDLAIIRINIRSREILEKITPACLPDDSYQIPVGTKCKIMGHGFVDAYAEDSFQMPALLQMADVHISENSICKAEVDSEAIKSKINENTLCIRGPIHPCVGDSGGPLVCKGEKPNKILGDSEYDYSYDDYEEDDEEWYLTGVTSFAVSTDLNDKCGLFKSAVFGKVANNMQWIKNTCKF